MRSILQNKFSRHVLFWIGVVVCMPSFEFISAHELLSTESYVTLYWINFFSESLPIYLLFTYSLLYGVVPLLLQKRYILSLVAVFFLMLLSSISQRLLSEIDLYFVQPFVLNFSSEIPFSWAAVWDEWRTGANWMTFSYDFILIGFVAAGINLFDAWTIKQRENQQLQHQKLKADQQLLKLRLNPVFLFNSLDTVYNLATHKSKQAPKVVLDLAHFLRYVLYESQADTVPLYKEIDLIEYYVSLQRTIHDAGLDISLAIRGNTQNQIIAPLSLFPIIEHAFRHSINVSVAGLPINKEPAWVSVDLSISEAHLTLKVINGNATDASEDAAWIADIQKRLRFDYPDEFDFQVRAEPDAYVVSLKLPVRRPHQNMAPLDTH